MSRYHRHPLSYPANLKLKVMDLEKSLKFYTEILGLTIIEEGEEYKLSADLINPLVIITRPNNAIIKPPHTTGLYHYAIKLPSRLDLGKFINHVKDKDIEIVGGANHGVSEAFYIEDYEGNGIEIYADTDEKNWFVNGKLKMVTDPLDYRELMSLAQGDIWDGMPKEAVLGHMHLYVDNLEKNAIFYELLGFEKTLALPNSAYFYSQGGYHHHIGFNVWNGREIPPPPENAIGLDYYTIKVSTKEKLMDLEKKLIENNYLTQKNDEKILTKDPAGNKIILEI
ncbi:MAG: VOC family protein [Tissierellales bacterium]|nr:VOC family protein [Tissierellales bacterium]